MNQHAQRTGLLMAAALLASVSTETSWADGDRHYDKHGYRQHWVEQHHHYAPKPYYRRHDSDDDEKLIYGLLVGGLFGYVIGNTQQQDSYTSQQYLPPAEPRYQSYQAYEPGAACLQEREYQMQVMVGGKEAQAYGTACLQPDGSWFRGPAKVVSR